MSSRFLLIFALPVLTCGVALAQQRVPWTTSHIHGTPEPPPPFVVERMFPELTFVKPLDITPIPGTDRLVVLEEMGRMFSFVPTAGADKADVFGELSGF